ncbi:hypothetical protein ACEPPN_019516 [Leptodophora sp. 'Broadleaf-Isolate-01']
MGALEFQHDKLPRGCIRLLRVERFDSAGRLECSLKSNEITDSLEFYALSYVWGSDITSRTIRCNSKDLPVTESLHEALTALQPSLAGDTCPIWVDAICINQRDDAEKEREVAHMDDIYRRAKSGLIWLGLAARNSDIAMRYIENFATALPKLKHPPRIEDLEKLGLPHKDHPVWCAIGHLYRRNWFGRLWTFQEAVLATSLKVICGQETADWEPFCQVGSELNHTQLFLHAISNQDLKDVEDGFRAVSYVSWAKMYRKMVGDDLAKEAGNDPNSSDGKLFSETAAHQHFASLLLVSQHKLCRDPRDRVSRLENFEARYLYLTPKTPENSISKSLLAGKPRLPGIPTWCSDLSISLREILPFDVYLMAGCLEADTKNHTSEATLRTFPDKERIETVGFRADIVDRIIPPGGPFRSGPIRDRAASRHTWLKCCLELAKTTRNKDISKDDIYLAHIYTVTANTVSRVPDGQALKQAYEDVKAYQDSQIKGLAGDKLFTPPEDRLPLFTDATTQIYRACAGRAYFTTVGGRLGIGPPEVKSGDVVVVVYGARPVFVLRERSESKAFDFVGDAFIHGLMELIRTPAEAIGKKETFCIV